MNEMIEKVARVIALWVGYMGVLDTMPSGDPGDSRNEAWIERQFRPFLPAAQAVIEGMREPIKKMEAAGGIKQDCSWETDDEATVTEIWQAMIDEALKDTPETPSGEA